MEDFSPPLKNRTPAVVADDSKGQTEQKVCAMNILTDHRRSLRTDLPCRSALTWPSPISGAPRSETLHSTRSHLSDDYHITLRRRTARIPLNCRDLRHFPFVCSKIDYHINSDSVAHPYRPVPSNQKRISVSINFLVAERGPSESFSQMLHFFTEPLGFTNFTRSSQPANPGRIPGPSDKPLRQKHTQSTKNTLDLL